MSEAANPMCQYFALCDRPADGTVAHPILGAVPCCERCAGVAGAELQAFPRDAPSDQKPRWSNPIRLLFAVILTLTALVVTGGAMGLFN